MGLFSNDKKPCPICGGPTPRLLPTKIEDTPICKECAGKIDLPNGAQNGMSLEDFRQYIAFYDQNQELRDAFSETYRYDFGFFGGNLLLDSTQGLFRLKNSNTSLVFEAANLKAFRILEDGAPLFEGSREALRCCKSDVEDRARAMEPKITRYMMELREHEMLERIDRLRDRHDEDDHDSHFDAPTFDEQAPVQKFSVELTLEHPYWENCSWQTGAPTFDRECPSVEGYLCDYRNKVEDLHILAVNLMQLLNPGAPEIKEGESTAAQAAAQTAPVTDIAAEIKKYKELLDAGILTEEEFTAKKKQLLGI